MTARLESVRTTRKSRPQARRAWAALSWGAVAFLVINAIANRWLPGKLEPWNQPFFHLRREPLVRRLDELTRASGPVNDSRKTHATAGPARPRIAAAFGSSRFMGGLDGSALESEFSREWGGTWLVVNFGLPGGGPIDAYVYLQRLFREGPQPDLVLIEVLPNQLNEAPGHSPRLSQSTALSDVDQSLLTSEGIPFSSDQAIQRSQFPCALWAYRKELLRVVFPRLLHASDPAVMLRSRDPYGTVPIRANIDEQQRQRAIAGTRVTFQEGARHFRLGGEGVTAMEAALRLCQEEGVPAGLVIMPEGPVFQEWYREGAKEELRVAIRDLAARNNAQVIDCWDSQPEEAFLDSHHLLRHAASEVSLRLAQQSVACLEIVPETVRISSRSLRPPQN
ncbi:MAG: hypothetical protein U1A77_08830 [Pirellulales bacterium]